MYLTYKNFSVWVGISHQRSNLFAMLKEAWLTKRTLVLPTFGLAAHHNYGRALSTQLGEYFDFETARVNGERVRVRYQLPEAELPSICLGPSESALGLSDPLVIRDVHKVGLVRLPLEEIYPGFKQLGASIQIHGELAEMAKATASYVSHDSVWIHVRRGDLLHKTESATSPENIERVVSEVAPSATTIYIATNEPVWDHFGPLSRRYRLMKSDDIPAFRELGRHDNYKLFLVEQAFAELFPVRIS